MAGPIRFWGRVQTLQPRLVLSKFEGETKASCPGYIARVVGTLTEGTAPPVSRSFTVAIGPATLRARELTQGDLLRGDAHPVPDALPDVPAELYKVGVLRRIAPAESPVAHDPPRTDPPLMPEAVEAAPRRALQPSLLDPGGSCHDCGYGVVACVVRLTDPRLYRNGSWSQVPACLGPLDCPHFQPREG